MAGSRVFGRTFGWWMFGYALLLAVAVWSVIAARSWALEELSTPASTAEWEDWRQDVRTQQAQPMPIQRRVPKSAEPPALMLMRDYFAIAMAAAVVFSTLIYWVLAWLAMGALSPQMRD
jgi:amino acid transporter